MGNSVGKVCIIEMFSPNFFANYSIARGPTVALRICA
jgi:hypothetical protein